jgi:hypothetical protein
MHKMIVVASSGKASEYQRRPELNQAMSNEKKEMKKRAVRIMVQDMIRVRV